MWRIILSSGLLALSSCDDDGSGINSESDVAEVGDQLDASVNDALFDALDDPNQDAELNDAPTDADTNDAQADADLDLPEEIGPSSDRHNPRQLGRVDGAANGYYEYLPPAFEQRRNPPLLVFWHGVGENGNGTTELLRVLNNGPPGLINRDQWPADRPFVVLSPQHAGTGCPTAAEIRDFLAFALETYDVDPNRVYLTGLSCGAIGSWNYLGEDLNQTVAAAVLIAGNGVGAWNRSGCALGRVPIWAFHGDADDVVAPTGSIDPLEDLQGCQDPPAVDARLTVYPDVGHDSWSRTYDLSAGHDVYTWLLNHRHR